MADELDGVKGVETTEPAPVPLAQPAPADDPVQNLSQLLEEKAKAERDRDNYRTLALKYKTQDELTKDVSALVPKDEILTPKTEGQPPAESETIDLETAKAALRQNAELRLLLQGKSKIQAVGAGTTGDTPPTKNAYFTAEQKAEMKRRWSLANIPESQHAEMLKRAEQAARST